MTTQTLTIPNIPKSLNELFKLGGFGRNRHKNDILGEVFLEIKRQKIKPIIGVVSLVYELTFEKRRARDLDNFIAGTKYWTDALRKAKIIAEDNSEVLKAISVEFKQGEKLQTIIRIIGNV